MTRHVEKTDRFVSRLLGTALFYSRKNPQAISRPSLQRKECWWKGLERKDQSSKGRYVFSWGGRAGEFWYFFPKKVLALPCVLIKKLLTPHL